MITHVVLFKLVNSNRDSVEATRKVLSGMAGKIAQLRHLEVGANVVPSDRAYDLALIAQFNSLEDLAAYQNHPVHLEVLQYLQGVRQSVVTVDYATA